MRRSRSIPLALPILLALLLACTGHAKEPAAYSLTLPPLRAFDRLAELKVGTAPILADDERKLLEAVWERKASSRASGKVREDDLVVDTMLFASGIDRAEARKKYRQRLEELIGKARQDLKGIASARERGERLMRFLHSSAMSKGYVAKQTSLPAVLDAGTFNCVSATAMYYLVGARLDLKLEALSISGGPFLPGHATLDLLDGDKRIDLEPTNPNGFDWKAKTSRPGVIVLGFVPDRKGGRAVDGFGIAAMIYSNRGVELAGLKPPQRGEAIRCYLSALALDPASPMARDNLLSAFTNWGPALSAEGKFEEALRVLAFGLSLSPKSSALQNNYRVVWRKHIDRTLDAGDDSAALKLIARAGEAVAQDRDYKSPGYWYIRLGEKRLKDKGWETGLEVVGRGVKVLPAGEGKKLLAWRSSVFRRWSQALLGKKDAAGSLEVLARAYALDAKDREVHEGSAYHTQEALRILEEKKGVATAVEHYQAVRKQLPAVKEVEETGQAHAVRGVRKLASAGKYKEALALAKQYEPLLAGPAQRAEVGAIAYDAWGKRLAGEKKWKEGLEKYVEGLKAFPRQSLLTDNAVALVDRWARTAFPAKDWDEAIRIYKIGLGHFPDSGTLKNNLHYCEQKKQKK